MSTLNDFHGQNSNDLTVHPHIDPEFEAELNNNNNIYTNTKLATALMNADSALSEALTIPQYVELAASLDWSTIAPKTVTSPTRVLPERLQTPSTGLIIIPDGTTYNLSEDEKPFTNNTFLQNHEIIQDNLIERGIYTNTQLENLLYSRNQRSTLSETDQAALSFLETHLKNKEWTTLAESLPFEHTHSELTNASVHNFEPANTPLETISKYGEEVILTTLTPYGEIIKLGDLREVEVSGTGWGHTRSSHTLERYVTSLSTYSFRTTPNPTRDNIGKGDNTNTTRKPPAETSTLVSESTRIDDLRHRYTAEKRDSVDIPDGVNGWTLEKATTADYRSTDPNDTPTVGNALADTYDEIVWSNNDDGTSITAKWRPVFNCWRLSTPKPVFDDGNKNDVALYEYDVNNSIVTTDDIIDAAIQAMNAIDPSEYQRPYTLEDPEELSENTTRQQPPEKLPQRLGDWVLTDRYTTWAQYTNINNDSDWYKCDLKINSTGSITISGYTYNEDGTRDRHFTSTPNQSDSNRYRDLYDEQWHYALAAMIQTTENHPAPFDNATTILNALSPTYDELETLSVPLDLSLPENMQ